MVEPMRREDNRDTILVLFSTSWGEVDWILPVLYELKLQQPAWRIVAAFSSANLRAQGGNNHALHSELSQVADDIVCPHPPSGVIPSLKAKTIYRLGQLLPESGPVRTLARRAACLITGAVPQASNSRVNSVNWSPDGQYVAVGGNGLTGGTGDELQIFRFDRAAGILTSITGALPEASNDSVNSVNWSPDGQYVVLGAGVSGGELQIFRFDRAGGILTSITGALGTAGFVQSVNWSPDGQFLAVGGGGFTGDEFQILTGLQFPSKNVIKNNTVYCNSGGEIPSGVGISGSNIANLIIGNTSYSNPIPSGENAPIVSSNYEFVTNAFDANTSGNIANKFDNVGYDGCAPITPTINLFQRFEILEGKMEVT